MTTRRWLASIAILLVVIGVGIFALRRGTAVDGGTDTTAAATQPDVATSVARRGEFIERVSAQGRIGSPAGSNTKLVFAESGIVSTIDVRVGERVAAGTIVATLDRSALAAALAQAEGDARGAAASYANGAIPRASLASARAKLATAQDRLATLERGGPAALSTRIAAASAARQAALKVQTDRAAVARTQVLYEGGVLAQKDLENARATLAADEADARAADAKVATAGTDFAEALAAARADVATARNDLATARSQQDVLGGAAASARARLDAAHIAYDNGALTAPTAGVVLTIAKHPGEAVDPSQTVVEIGPGTSDGVTLNVPGDVARRLHVGDPATLELPQTRAHMARGRVVAIVPAIDPMTQLATVVLGGAPSDVVPGDAVTATIVVGHLSGIIVPSSAIVEDPQTGKTVVFIREQHPKSGDSAFTMRPVVVRASDASTAAIASGLAPNETIATRGAYALLAPAGG